MKTQTQAIEMTAKELKLAKVISITTLFLSSAMLLLPLEVGWHPVFWLFVITGFFSGIGIFVVDIMVWWYHG